MLHIDYITNSIFNSRTYILSDGSDKVWLVDCGDVEPLLSIVGSRNVRVLKEGDKVFGFDVYETPGHNPSCLCYANDDVIFTGDAYIPGCKVVTNLPHCDGKLAQSSVERILKLSVGKCIFPGHEV